MSVSVCIIAHNEAESLPRTLASVRWADEVVVVDCGSDDDTAAVAAAAGCRVLRRENLANLNVNKNESFRQATCDWILCVDADEVIPDALAREIRAVLGAGPAETGFFIKRRNHFLGRFLRHGGQYPDKQLRLFRRGQGRFPERHVHERLALDGVAGMLAEPFDHNPYPTMRRMVEKLNFYSDFEAGLLAREGTRFRVRRFVRVLFVSHLRLARRYVLKGGVRDGLPGFAAAYADLAGRIVTECKLWERTYRPEDRA